MGGLVFFLMKFCGNRNGLDDADGNDIKWPELKHSAGEDEDGAIMQPLPARRREGAAGFDMGEEEDDVASMRDGAGGAGVAGGYGSKMVENDSTAHLTGAGAYGHGSGMGMGMGMGEGYPPDYASGYDQHYPSGVGYDAPQHGYEAQSHQQQHFSGVYDEGQRYDYDPAGQGQYGHGHGQMYPHHR